METTQHRTTQHRTTQPSTTFDIGASPSGTHRRTLLRGAAWSVPAVTLATSSPAFAASACAPNTSHTVLWNSATWAHTSTADGLSGTGAVIASPSGTAAGTRIEPLTVTAVNRFVGNMRGRSGNGAGNMQISPHNVGGGNRPGLEMWNALTGDGSRTSTATTNDRQEITFDFGRPVTDLTFTITDIDAFKSRDASVATSARYQYVDSVHLDVTPTSGVRGANVAGSGTAADPWRSNQTPNTTTIGQPGASGLDNVTSNLGNVRVTLAGPIERFTLTFRNTETRALLNNGSQAIYLTDFAFRANTCA